MTFRERLKSRKLWAWVAMCTLATVMRYDGAIDPANWETVVMWVTMAYVASQAAVDTWKPK